MKARIFISHSAKDFMAEAPAPGDDEAEARFRRLEYARWVRSAVVDRLRASGKFDVWLDVSCLEPGDAWRALLSRWLGSCDGAVILLNEEAAASQWVRKEATILTWRQSLRSGVRIVPALLGDFDAGRLTGLGLEDVKEIQTARLKSKELTPENAELLADQIVGKFEGLTVDETQTPMAEWVEDVVATLDGVSAVHFRRAARLLGIEDADLSHFPDHELTMAHQLLYADLDSAYDALVQLQRGLKRENFSRLVDLLLPIWVDPEAARNLQAIVARSREHRVLAINAEYQDTATAYILRSSCCTIPASQIIGTADIVGLGLAEELMPRYEGALRRKLGLGHMPPDKGLRALRDYLDSGRVEMFILLGDGIVQADLVQAFREKYPKVTYVLLSGDDFPQLASKIPGVKLIRPELEEGAEDHAVTSCARVLNLRGSR